MPTLPPVVGRLVGDNSDYVRSLNQAEAATKGSTDRSAGHFSKLGDHIKKAVLLGTAAAGAAVAGFAVKAISAASDLAETISKVGVVFGDQAAQVTGFANQMAKDFGLPKTQILDAAASIGLIGKASGLSQGDAAKMSTQLAKLAADASSFYNVPLPEALQAIQSGLVGEAEPMRRFGVLLNEQSVSAEAARLGLAKTNGEYSEGAKAQARASLIMRGMTDASGDLERTQGSLANRLRELKGRAENFAAAAGEKMVPVLLKLLDFGERVGSVVGPALRGVFDIVAKGDFTGGFSALGIEEDSPIIAGLFRFRETALAVFNRVKAIVFDFKTALGLALGGEAFEAMTGPQRFARMVGTVFQNVVAIVSAAMPVVLEVVSGVVSMLSNLWETHGARIMATVSALSTIIRTVLVAAFAVLQAVLPVVVGLVNGLVDAIDNPAFAVVAGIIAASFIPTLVALGVSYAVLAAQAVAATAVTVAQFVIQGAQWVWMGITALASAAQVAAAWLIALGPIALVVAAVVAAAVLIVANWDWIKETVGNVVSAVGGFLSNLIGGLVNFVQQWGVLLLGPVGAMWKFRDEIWGVVVAAIGFFGRLVSGVTDKVGELISEVAGLPRRILGALGNLGGLLWDAGINLIEGLIGGIRAMAGRAASAAWDVVKGAVSAAWNALRPGSPSREGAAIGVNFGQGLVAGMAKMRGEVAGAAGSLVAGAISAAGGTGGPALGGLGGGGAVAAGSAIAASAAGGQGGGNYYVTVQIVAPTGDIPDSTMRKFREQLLRMRDDFPAGSIVPAA